MKAVAINGSPRKGGNTEILLNKTLAPLAAAGWEGAFDDDIVNLGDLKGNIGDQNYEIPADVRLDRFQSAVVWCQRFGVGFAVAPLR